MFSALFTKFLYSKDIADPRFMSIWISELLKVVSKLLKKTTQYFFKEQFVLMFVFFTKTAPSLKSRRQNKTTMIQLSIS